MDSLDGVKGLGKSRRAAYQFIRDEVAAGRGFPSHTAIAEHMGWKNVGSAIDCLSALVRHRLLLRYYEGSRVRFSLVECSPVGAVSRPIRERSRSGRRKSPAMV